MRVKMKNKILIGKNFDNMKKKKSFNNEAYHMHEKLFMDKIDHNYIIVHR